MYELYQLEINNKVFLERTLLGAMKMIEYHHQKLRDDEHWNKLMQLEYNQDKNFSYTIIEKSENPEDIDKLFFKKIEDTNATLAPYGYNMFWDRKKKQQRITVFDTDILYLRENNYTLKEVKEITGASMSAITFRMNRNLNPRKRISTHADFKLMALQVLYMQDEPLTAARIINKTYHNHDVSDSFATSSKQLTRYFKEVGLDFEKENGTNVYKNNV